MPAKKDINNSYGPDNDLEKAEELNELFANVGNRMYERTQRQVNRTKSDQEASRYNEVQEHFFRPAPVDMNTAILNIKHLKKHQSCGSDAISLPHIRDSLTVIIHYLTIINTSIVTGNLFSAWKHATVTPIFKSGDRSDVGNYRPISLLPILSKVFEKVVAQQHTALLQSKEIFSKYQHGFRPQLSTKTALTTLPTTLYSNMDNKKVSLLTLLDLSRDFYSEHHVTLLEKLVKTQVSPF